MFIDYNKFWSICETEEQRQELMKRSDRDPITRKEFDQLRKIIDHIVAQKCPVTSAEISEIFGIQETTTGWMNTRAAIKDGIRHYASIAGIPIGAGNSGYFLMEDETQIDKYCENLSSRIKGMEERILLVREAWENKDQE